MVVVGLTGGIGSGKSTVARMLVELGAVVIDADTIARKVMAPGGAAHEAVIGRFGAAGTAVNGSIDRPALAALVFGDEGARRDLNAIVHPAVREEMLRQVEAAVAADPGAAVVLDVPLLAEVGRDRYPVDGVLVVEAPGQQVIARLVGSRGYSEEEAGSRMAAQATREERRAIADVVIDNSGDLDHLVAEVKRAWAWIQSLAVPPGS